MKDFALIAAKEMQSSLSENYRLVPGNHHQLFGLWYLIPPQTTTKKLGPPYYYLGKFVFSVEGENEANAQLFGGVYIEKGSLDSTPTEDFWYWNTFMRKVQAGDIEKDLNAVSEQINDPILIKINVRMGSKLKCLKYDWKNGQLQSMDCTCHESLDPLPNFPSDSEGLDKIVIYLSKLEWAWVDVFFGINISIKEYSEKKDVLITVLEQLENYASE